MHPFPLQLFVAKPSLEDHVAEEDLMSSAASSRRESYCSSDGDQLRRRSSTSDVLRFRQRMRQTSTHESHEEIVDPVEDSKGDAKSKNVSEPEITFNSLFKRACEGDPWRSAFKLLQHSLTFQYTHLRD